jgi:hypothetical protein
LRIGNSRESCILCPAIRARWRAQETHAPLWGDGSTITQRGSIDLGGTVYEIGISGTGNRVNSFALSSPGDDLLKWAPVERALGAIGMEARNIGCHSPTGFGYVRLTDPAGQSAILHKSVNYGSAVASTDQYAFVLDNPFDGSTEAAIAADRSFCD